MPACPAAPFLNALHDITVSLADKSSLRTTLTDILKTLETRLGLLRHISSFRIRKAVTCVFPCALDNHAPMSPTCRAGA